MKLSLCRPVFIALSILMVNAIFFHTANAQPLAAKRYASSTLFQKQWEKNNSQTAQRVTTGQTTRRITVDGLIGAGEWADASEVSGLIDTAFFGSALYQTRLWLTYDRRFLYLAMQSQLPASAKNLPAGSSNEALLRSRAIADDTNVDFDDSLALDIVPRYPNGNLYKMYVNDIGTRYDYLFYNQGDYAVDIKWDPQWVSKSRVSGRNWSLEVAIPIAAFGTATIKDGETWALNIQRIWRMLRTGIDQWSVGGTDGKNPCLPWRMGALGQAQFVGLQNVVVKDQSSRSLLNGVLVGHLHLRNRSKRSQKITTQLSLSGKVLSSRHTNLAISGSQVVDLKADLRQSMAGLLDISVADEAGKILYRQQRPFRPQDGLSVDVKSYPSRNLLQAAWELRLPEEDLKSYSLGFALYAKGQGRALDTKQIKDLKTLKSSADFSTKGLPNGDYHLNVALKKDGKTIATRYLAYTKQPMPGWFGNKFGISQNPPPPWKPILEKNDRIDIWNRQIRYDGRLFPSQIINKKTPMLARPIELTFQTAGQGRISTAQNRSAAKLQWKQKNPQRVTSTRVQDIDDIRISSTSYVEFDGMTWIELELKPRAKEVLLRNLSFNIPLHKSWADLVNTFDYTLRTTGKLGPKGWSGRMRPLWVGNGDGGLQFFAETDAIWRGSKQLAVRHQGNAVVLQASLVDTPIKLGKPLKFAFGFITTPVKPAPANHRDWRVISGYTNEDGVRDAYFKAVAAKERKVQIFDIWNQGWWWLPSKYQGDSDSTGFSALPGPSAEPSYFGKISSGHTIRRSLYGRLSQIGTDNPWFRQFGDEWVSDSNTILNIPPSANSPLARAEVSATSASYRDFVAWGYHELMTKHRVPGLYFDLSAAVEDNNIYHGGGVATGSGGAIPAQSILGQRELFKRIYTMLKQRDPQAMIFHHMSGHVMMPVDSFVDAQVDGENGYALLDHDKNRGYEKILSLDQFRAEYAGQNNLGPVGIMLDQFGRRGSITGDQWKTLRHHGDYLVGMSLLHDSTNWWSYMPTAVYTDMYRALDGVGVDSSYIFSPYWRQRALKLPAGVAASFYVSPQRKKAALVLLNASSRAQNIALNFNTAKLGLSGKRPVVKTLFPPECVSDNGADQVIKLLAYRVRIFELRTP